MKNYLVYSSVLLLFFSCEGAGSVTIEQQQVSYPSILSGQNHTNELFLDGNRITLEYVESEKKGSAGEEEIFSVQQIEQHRQDLVFRAKRIPKQLYLLNQGLTGEELELAMADLKNEQLFYFEFEESQKQDLLKKYFEKDLDAAVSYLSFEIQHDFKLINSQGDTIPAAYTLYERNFHVAPFEKLIVGFSGDDETDRVKLIYTDHLFEKGTSEFSFASSSDIKNTTKQPS